MSRARLLVLAWTTVALLTAVAPATAQPDEFYAGKTLKIFSSASKPAGRSIR